MSLLDKTLITLMPLVPQPIVGYFSRPYIAGADLVDGIAKTRQLIEEGCIATLDVLGEEVANRAETEFFTEQYLIALDRIEAEKIECNISIKATAIGLTIDSELCENNLRRVLTRARELNNFVRIDMEDSSVTTATLDLYRKLRDEFDNTGIVLQSYMKRSLDDIAELVRLQVNVRVCKGIYVEPPEIAYKDPQRIRDNFMEMVENLFGAGCYVGIATHDRQLVERSIELVRRLGLGPEDYEFQMLLGVTPALRREILADGHRMRVYVPFGEQWYAYSMRRLKENPAVAGHIFRAIFKTKA